jgi:DNA polymerase-3 subunit delta
MICLNEYRIFAVMTIRQIRDDWKKGKFMPVYLFYGEETYLRDELLHSAIDSAVPDPSLRAFNLDIFTGGESSMSKIIQAASSFPVMADRRLVIVKDAAELFNFRAKDSSDGATFGKDHPVVVRLLEYFNKPNNDCVLIFDSTTIGPKNTYPWRAFVAQCIVLECSPLNPAEASQWLEDRVKSLSRSIERDAVYLLTEYVGTDLRSLMAELQKIISFIGDREMITAADVRTVVANTSTFTIFELTNAIGNIDKKKSLEIALSLLADDKGAWFQMQSLIIKYLEQLIVARELASRNTPEKDIAAAIGLGGNAAYYAKNYIQASRRFSRDQLDNALKAVVRSERQSRFVNTGDALMVERLLAEIIPSR